MPTTPARAELISSKMRGRTLSHVLASPVGTLTLHFADGSRIRIEDSKAGFRVHVQTPADLPPNTQRPTSRQREYLAFIATYMSRFGRAPAEADIQRHFLVSAPSVNQMMQMLERRGFIARTPGVARSIRLLGEFGA